MKLVQFGSGKLFFLRIFSCSLRSQHNRLLWECDFCFLITLLDAVGRMRSMLYYVVGLGGIDARGCMRSMLYYVSGLGGIDMGGARYGLFGGLDYID